MSEANGKKSGKVKQKVTSDVPNDTPKALQKSKKPKLVEAQDAAPGIDEKKKTKKTGPRSTEADVDAEVAADPPSEKEPKGKKQKMSKEQKQRAIEEEKNKVAPISTDLLSSIGFKTLNLSEPIQSAMTAVRKQEFLSHVQAEALPHALKQLDVVIQAKPATGRTLTFVMAVLEGLGKAPPRGIHASALIISSNTVRCKHIQQELETLSRFRSYPMNVLSAAQSIDRDRKRLSKPMDIVIATPERLVEHMQKTPRFIDKIDEVRFVVIDQLDALLESGVCTQVIMARESLFLSISMCLHGVRRSSLFTCKAFRVHFPENQCPHPHAAPSILCISASLHFSAIFSRAFLLYFCCAVTHVMYVL